MILLTWNGTSNDITLNKDYKILGNTHIGFYFKDDINQQRNFNIGTWSRAVQGIQHKNTFLSPTDTRKQNLGNSNYADHKIQVWDIWKEYSLNPWDADIVKRILRTKNDAGMTAREQRILDYKKVIHICQERINQLEE